MHVQYILLHIYAYRWYLISITYFNQYFRFIDMSSPIGVIIAFIGYAMQYTTRSKTNEMFSEQLA